MCLVIVFCKHLCDLEVANNFCLQKIADFGLAAKLNLPSEKHYTMCGTPNFISP